LRESYISFSPSAGFLEANKNGILENSNFTWAYYALIAEVKSPTLPRSRDLGNVRWLRWPPFGCREGLVSIIFGLITDD
jgi:hypothetical protein